MSMPSTQPQSAQTVSKASLGLLLGSSLANVILSVYQWNELMVVRGGGDTSCSINATVNCATVWNSPFASKVHELLGMPVAGLGLVWAAAALILSMSVWRSMKGAPLGAFLSAAKIHSIVGLIAIFVFASASAAQRVVCLTCLGTYALVVLFAIGAFMGNGPVLPSDENLRKGLGWVLMVTAPVFLVALLPGSKTPKAAASAMTMGENALPARPVDADLVRAFEMMEPQQAQFASVARAKWLAASDTSGLAFPTRARWGSENAPVKIVDFTDIRCPHCKIFEQFTIRLRELMAPGQFSVEARHFPLDGECNPHLQRVAGDGVQCLAAKVQICLEGQDAMWVVREHLFEQQESLTKEVIFQTASKAGVDRQTLEACVATEATKKKLDDDIAFGMALKLQGTPLVLLNGKETFPSEPFITGMIATGGDANAPLFAKLPPPPPPTAQP